MSTGELLNIEPPELKFALELKTQVACSLRLSNKTDSYVAFKVKTTNPKKYCVRPNTGIVLPRSTCAIIVTMQAHKEAPADMQCKDKFLLQSVKVPQGSTTKDINSDMFRKEAGNVVEECKLRVVYVPPQSPKEEPKERSSPQAPLSENGTVTASELSSAAKTSVCLDDPQDKSAEAQALISRLTEEKNKAIQQSNRLRQELELMRQERGREKGGVVSLIYVMMVGLVGILLGYLLNKF